MSIKEKFQSLVCRFATKNVLRLSVWSLQVVGLFPYTWPGPPREPQLSVPLCVWSAFVKILLGLAIYFLFLSEEALFSYHRKANDLYDMTQMIAILIYICGSCQPQIVMFVRSRKLAKFLSCFPFEESNLSRISVSPLVLVTAVPLEVLALVFAMSLPCVPSNGHLLLLAFSALVVGHGNFSMYLLFKTLSVTLSSYLLDVVEEALSSRPPPPPPPSSSSSSSSPAASSLLLLEKKIRKVDETRVNLISCFLEVTSAYLAASTVCVVGTFFRFLVLQSETGISILILTMNLFTIAGLCEIGQCFEDKVETAVEKLKNFSCEVSEEELKAQIYRLVRFLEPLRRFSMCGWYTMNKTLLLSMSSVVMTYLVVLLQVRGQVSDEAEQV